MSDLPRILVGVTTYEKKDYIFDECMKHIAQMDYPKSRIDVVIVDNTKTPEYYYKLIRRGYKKVYRVERGENSREALTKAQNKIRRVFLDGDYDYLLFIESDLLVPPDTVKRLLSYNKDVVGSTYIIGTGNVKVPCIFVDDVVEGGFRGTRPIGIKKNSLGQKYFDEKEVMDFLSRRDKLQQVHGVGFGCTLIARKIFLDREDVPENDPRRKGVVFWYDIRFNDKHSDVYFYLDMSRRGVPVFVDISVVVPHHPTDWATVHDR